MLGAILAKSSLEVANGLYDFGVLIGEIMQIEDDLEDAFSRPANLDRFRQGNILLTIYALDAEHQHRDEFLSLLLNVPNNETDALVRTKEILIKSGAASYAAYHLVQRFQQSRKVLEKLSLPVPDPIAQILNNYGKTLSGLLNLGGVEIDLARLRTESVSLIPNEGDRSWFGQC
jgi:geranylgeranyl pyrophosphate synthase